jgi:hypothetical protein
MEYVSPPVMFYGDGALAANAAVISANHVDNARIYAVNEQANPMANKLTKYIFWQPSEAIYTPALANVGFTRQMFDDLVRDLENIRQGVQAQTQTFTTCMAIMALPCSLGASLLCIKPIGDEGWGKKDVTQAVPPARRHIEQVNSELRGKGLPIQWRIEQVPFSSHIEIVAYHSPL